MAWVRYKRMDLQTEGVHVVSGTHQEIRFDQRVQGGLVNVRHRSDLRKLLDSGRYEIALDHPAHGGIRYDEEGWEIAPAPSTPPQTTAKPGRPRGR